MFFKLEIALDCSYILVQTGFFKHLKEQFKVFKKELFS